MPTPVRTVLLVDDEPQIRAIQRAYLDADGFRVLEAATGAEALEHFAAEPTIDAVLLDIGLPDQSGLEVLRTLRTRSEVCVILVTARADEVDKLVGLGVGADDYVTKPFSPRELVARVHTVLRRRPSGEPPPNPDAPLRFAGLTIDRGRREVTTPQGRAELSALDFDILWVLAQSPGRVYSRSQLLEKVWGYDFYGDERVVDVHIRTLRAALGDDAHEPRIIATVRGVGYKFLPVTP